MQRRWYHLHLVTCLVTFGLGWLLAWLNLPSIGFDSEPTPLWFHGWPMRQWDDEWLRDNYSFETSGWVKENDSIGATFWQRVNFRQAAINIPICLVLVISTAFASEQFLRRPVWQRFGLREAFLFVATISAVLAIWKWNRLVDGGSPRVLLWQHGEPAATYLGLSDYPCSLSIPIYFAIACTIYTASWLAAHLADRCFRIAARRFRRSSPA